jgi:hypothetical protein
MVRSAALILLAMQASPDAWVHVLTTNDGDVWSIRARDKHQASDEPKVWVTIDHSANKTVSERRTLMRFGFNCASETYGEGTQNKYDSKGRATLSSSIPDYQIRYVPIAPGTTADVLMHEVCAEK